jgi:hypothetical protein
MWPGAAAWRRSPPARPAGTRRPGAAVEHARCGCASGRVQHPPPQPRRRYSGPRGSPVADRMDGRCQAVRIRHQDRLVEHLGRNRRDPGAIGRRDEFTHIQRALAYSPTGEMSRCQRVIHATSKAPFVLAIPNASRIEAPPAWPIAGSGRRASVIVDEPPQGRDGSDPEAARQPADPDLHRPCETPGQGGRITGGRCRYGIGTVYGKSPHSQQTAPALRPVLTPAPGGSRTCCGAQT